MQKLRPKSPDGVNSPSFYSSPPITTFDHTQISLLPVPKFQPASGKPRPRAGVLKSLQTSAQKRVRRSRCYSNLALQSLANRPGLPENLRESPKLMELASRE